MRPAFFCFFLRVKTTLKENLRWGNPDATDEELVKACKLAQAPRAKERKKYGLKKARRAPQFSKR